MEAAKSCWFFATTIRRAPVTLLWGCGDGPSAGQGCSGETRREGLGRVAGADDIVCRSDCTDEAIERTLRRLKNATVEIAGDTAALRIKWAKDEPLDKPVFFYSGDDPVARFRRVKDQWKLDGHEETGATLG